MANPGKNQLILHCFNGDEIFEVESAEMFLIDGDRGRTLWFEVETSRENASYCEDTKEMERDPNLEVGVDATDLDMGQLEGLTLLMPGTKTDDEDSCMSLFYYFTHQPLRQNTIDILSQSGDRFHIQWTAETQDVNYYDGSKPLTQVAIDSEFHFKDYDKWQSSSE